MAVHSANGVSYYLSVPLTEREQLGAIRHWQNLKMASDGETVWVKDFTPAQLDSLPVKTLPHKTLYYANGPQLFLQGSLLPCCPVPSVLWTPIDRGLPVRLPSGNHNYFGLQKKVPVRLQPLDVEREPWACLVKLDALRTYADTAPAVRLKGLGWVMVNNETALLTGTPLLPLPGQTYWRSGDFLFPSGYQLELPLLLDVLQTRLNPAAADWIVWAQNGDCWPVPKHNVMPLSVGSVRLSLIS